MMLAGNAVNVVILLFADVVATVFHCGLAIGGGVSFGVCLVPVPPKAKSSTSGLT